ncbi:MAG: hypothetical protein ACRDPW_03240, partial [Mycobacteriales bacterium]
AYPSRCKRCLPTTPQRPKHVSGGKEPVPRYELTFGLGIAADLAKLHAVEPTVLDAAQTVLDDLAHGRVIGKLLGDRNISGDLTGLARLKFDVADQRPLRFRVVYCRVNERTRDIVASAYARSTPSIA